MRPYEEMKDFICVLGNIFYIFVFNVGMRKTICYFISVCPSVLSEQ
jgi:hypothetical protein